MPLGQSGIHLATDRESARCYYLEDHTIGVGHDVLTIDVAPLIPAWRTAQMTCPPVADALAAIPVLTPHMLALSPVIVPDVLVVVLPLLVVFLIVVVVLSHGQQG